MADLIARALRFDDLPTTRGTRQQLTVILRGKRGAVTGTGERISELPPAGWLATPNGAETETQRALACSAPA
jgi:hypothetical protein